MRRLLLHRFLCAGFLVAVCGCQVGPRVAFVVGDQTIDVTIDGRTVTTYRSDDFLTKPVLYPVKTRPGLTLTRAFPLADLPGESKDHPHHVGLFFTYGDVNGVDYWGNTTSPPRIAHVSIETVDGGSGSGRLSVVHHWIDAQERVVLEERREMVFRALGDDYAIDFRIDLTAGEREVVFGETKEGMFAIRVAPWLREDAGQSSYVAASGAETAANIWGTRERWVSLQGEVDGRSAGVAIINHPRSVNYPTFWHARGYGLFAANPLGRFVFEKTRKVQNPEHERLILQPGETATFRFRVVIFEGRPAPAAVESWFADYVAR